MGASGGHSRVAADDGSGQLDLATLVLSEVNVDVRMGEVKGLPSNATFAALFGEIAEEEGGLMRVCGWRPRGDSNPRSPP